MTKRVGLSEEPPEKPVGESYYDSDMLHKMALRVMAAGFVPAEVLKEEFGPTKFTEGIAVLFRQFRMFREVRRPFGDENEQMLGYEWTNQIIPKTQIKRVPRELGFLLDMGNPVRPKYADFELVTVRCRWTTTPLGALPRKNGEDVLHVFERDYEGSVVIPAYCLRGMAKAALPLIGKEMSIAFKIGFASVILQSPNIKIVTTEHPIIDERGQGLGIKQSEAIYESTEFIIEAMVPTTALPVSDYLRMLALAGKFIRLSPARHTGYGDFKVVS